MQSKLNEPGGILSKKDIKKLHRTEERMHKLKLEIVFDMELRTELNVRIAEEKDMQKFVIYLRQRNELSEKITKNLNEYENLDLSRGAMEEFYQIK